MTSFQVYDLVAGLKSRHAETRHKAIRELLHFTKTDLREMSQESLTQVLDDFNKQIHTLTCSYDNNEKRAGILIIGMYFIGYTISICNYVNYAHKDMKVLPTLAIKHALKLVTK